MGRLHLQKDLQMSKAVISFWFRIPQETIDAARAQGEAYPPSFYPFIFRGIIPLIVFGNQVVAPVIEGDLRVVGTHWVLHGIGDIRLEPYVEVYPVSSSAVPYAPSFIGVECRDDGNNYVVVNLQTKDFPTVSGLNFVVASAEPTQELQVCSRQT